MNLNDLNQKLRANPEYAQAEAALAPRFHFANAVLRARIKRGWTQTELARRVGTRQANISNIEAGLANPTLDLIQRICAELDLRIDFSDAPCSPASVPTSSLRVDNVPGSPFRYTTGQVKLSVQEETWK